MIAKRQRAVQRRRVHACVLLVVRAQQQLHAQRQIEVQRATHAEFVAHAARFRRAADIVDAGILLQQARRDASAYALAYRTARCGLHIPAIETAIGQLGIALGLVCRPRGDEVHRSAGGIAALHGALRAFQNFHAREIVSQHARLHVGGEEHAIDMHRCCARRQRLMIHGAHAANLECRLRTIGDRGLHASKTLHHVFNAIDTGKIAP